MERVVITGLGLVSCLGNDRETVTQALKAGQSGVRFNPTYAERGLRSQVCARPDVDFNTIDRKLRRFMGDASAYAYLSAVAAIADAQLTLEEIANHPRYGVIAGSGGGSTQGVAEAMATYHDQGLRRVAPTFVPRTMTSTVAAALATGLKLQGINYALSSACATSAHCIGHAMELIQLGKQDLILAGGGEEEHWTQSMLFDAMGATSSHFNDQPEKASRPYAIDRDGFVPAGGGGIVVLESLTHAQARQAPILAELVGYAATSDGADMVAPSGEGAFRCMQQALAQAQAAGITQIDYLNTHGTGTPAGDIVELNAIERAFSPSTLLPQPPQCPPLSSTKSMTGHSLGAAGVHEVIYCLLMQAGQFIAPSINIEVRDPAAAGKDIVEQTRFGPIPVVMSNSFGFGGTNACLILKQWQA